MSKIFIECWDDLHTYITEHDTLNKEQQQAYIRNALHEFCNSWGVMPSGCKYKTDSRQDWKKINIDNYLYRKEER